MKTRRVLAVCLATILALTLMVPAVLAAEETVEDSFEDISYSGGSGWTSNWAEVNDDNKVNNGVIRVVSSNCDGSNCVRFNIGLLSLGTYGIGRTTDISGAEAATLTFKYRQGGLGTFQVWTRSGPSDGWAKTTLTGGLSDYSTASINVAGDASATTEVRFNLQSLLLGDSAYVDNVLITASYPTSTTTTTTTTTSSTTTTTTEPIITVPTIPPILPTTTTTTSAASSTTTTVSSSTTTTAGSTATSTTTSTAPPGAGSDGSDSPPGGGSSGDGDQATVNPPLTEEELDFAAESNIVVNLAGEGDFEGFEAGIGINPMTDLWVNLDTTVEVISTEILSGLALGAMIAFFGVRRVKDDDPVPQS